MKMMKHRVVAAAMSFLFLNLPGCGGASDRPELGLVTGTVLLDGQPLGGVSVTFQPDDGRPAIGKTAGDGKYKLTYIRNTPGCKIGHNRVEIGYGEDDNEGVPSEDDSTSQTPSPAPAPASKKKRIPARYNTKTELEADVKPGENTFDFKLEK